MNNPGQYLKIIREKRGLGVKAVYSKTGVGDCTIKNPCQFLWYKFNRAIQSIWIFG